MAIGSGDAGVRFPTTHLSAVHGARSDDARERERSWSALAAAYWRPAFKHVRVRWKMPREDAEDAIQGFFERAMEKDFFADYDPARSRFRAFFRLCLDRWMSNERKAAHRQKRGGDTKRLQLDVDDAEQELARAGAATWASPEACFDQEWQRSLFALAVIALEAECSASGKSGCFAVFKRYDLAEMSERPTYDAIAREFGLPTTTVNNHLSYARRELRRILIARLREITATDAELRSEAAALLGAHAA